MFEFEGFEKPRKWSWIIAGALIFLFTSYTWTGVIICAIGLLWHAPVDEIEEYEESEEAKNGKNTRTPDDDDDDDKDKGKDQS